MPERVEITSYDPLHIICDEDQVAAKILLVLPKVWVPIPRRGPAMALLGTIDRRQVGLPLQPTVTLSYTEPVNIGEWTQAFIHAEGAMQTLKEFSDKYAASVSEEMETLGSHTLERMNLIGILNSLEGIT
jgi:hypothetical protein